MTDERKAHIITRLDETRAGLNDLLEKIDETQWETAVYSEETLWTVSDILRHMSAAERSMIALMARIREGAEGAPADFDLNRWNASRVAKAKDKSAEEILVDMEHNRADLIKFIDALDNADWGKRGRHGSLRIMSIAEICETIADHEETHTADIRAALALE